MIRSTDFIPDIKTEIIAGTGRFRGDAVRTESNDRVESYLVDGAVKVTELSEKVRKAALAQFEKGMFSNALAIVGGLALFCTFVVMPVSSLIGYRIAASHLAHAAVAFATFIVGFAVLRMGIGDSPEDLKEKEFFEKSILTQVRTVRISAGKNPFEFLLNKSVHFHYFHQSDLLRLMVNAANEKITSANTPKKRAESLLELSKLFNNRPFNLYMGKESDTMAEVWQRIVLKWQNLFVDKTINNEIDTDIDKSMAEIEKTMHEAIASKWDAAIGIFREIQDLAS